MPSRPDEGRTEGERARSHHEAPPDDSSEVSLGFVVDQYLAELATRARERTVRETREALPRVVAEIGAASVSGLSRARILAWRQAKVTAGASNKTVNNLLAPLLAALALCVSLGQIQSHPLRGIRSLPVGPRYQRRRPRALSEWEVARLLGACAEIDREEDDHRGAKRTIAGGSKGRRYAVRDRSARIPQTPLVLALLETGARWGELTAATWGDLDEPMAALTFRGETTKTEAERTVPLSTGLLERLRAYRLLCAGSTGAMPSSAEPIFLSPAGRPWTSGTSNFRRFLSAAYERAGLLVRGTDRKLHSRDGRALNVHTLRHTCCTRLARSGAPLPVTQALLGHASPAMTARVYSHFEAEDARAFVERLHTLEVGSRVGHAEPEAPPGASGVGLDRSLDAQAETAAEKAPNARSSGS